MTQRAKYDALIVEDDPDISEWMVGLLRKRGCETELATTLADGLQKLVNEPPRCVLLDLRLPDGNGVEILRHIRRLKLPIRVAVVSGCTDSSAVGFAALLQPDAFFRKPVSGPELSGWVANCCRE